MLFVCKGLMLLPFYMYATQLLLLKGLGEEKQQRERQRKEDRERARKIDGGGDI